MLHKCDGILKGIVLSMLEFLSDPFPGDGCQFNLQLWLRKLRKKAWL